MISTISALTTILGELDDFDKEQRPESYPHISATPPRRPASIEMTVSVHPADKRSPVARCDCKYTALLETPEATRPEAGPPAEE